MDASVPQRTANVLEKDVDGELIIVNANTNELISLSDSGRAIWDLVDNRRTVGQIVAAICAEFEVGPDEEADAKEPPAAEGDVLAAEPGSVREQVGSFLDLLVDKGLATYNGERKEN